jgi:glycosyltransferase involved in cell wall biosynthesis
MQVAYINADYGVPAFGTKGGSIHIQEVIRAWCKRGVRVHLLTSTRGGDLPVDFACVRVSSIPGVRINSDVLRNRQLFESAVHFLNETLTKLLTMSNYISQFSLVYERYSLWSCSAMEVARQRGVPAILEVNSPLIEEQNRYRRPVDSTLARNVAKRAFSAANALIAVSQEVADYLTQFEEARGKITVIPNGVDLSRFPIGLSGSRRRCLGAFVVGFVGSLKPWHGMDVLVDAFALLSLRVPEARLLIVGDGPERSNIEQRIVRKGLSSLVDFTGEVPPNEIPGLLASMDLAVAPYAQSSEFYFSPLKIYEYMAASLPIVASDVGQIGEFVEHGLTGWLVPAGNCATLAEAIGNLKGRPDLMRAIGLAAREKVLRERTWDMVVERINSLMILRQQLTARSA